MERGRSVKKYLLWILAVYLVLMLLPLPLLGRANTDKNSTGKTSSSASATKASQTKTATSGSGSVSGGVFRLLDTDTNKVYEVADRDFLIGTVSAEMYPSYHLEALKAQAVASFTYYSAKRSQQRASPDASLKGADFADNNSGLPIYYTDSQLKEKWGSSYSSYHDKICSAVDAVSGKLITYNGQAIQAVYHAISSGTTEDAAVVWGNSFPYLKPVASPGDKLSPSYESNVSLTSDSFSKKMSAAVSGLKLSGDPSAWIGSNVQTSSSGTVKSIVVGGVTLTGTKVREALGLRSACFTVTYKNGSFLFDVLGYGHDVGMSQYGADYLARQGFTWDEILRYYYTGVTIQ